VRSDPTKDEEFKKDQGWNDKTLRILAFEPERGSSEDDPAFRGSPFSGNERNRLFMRNGDNYEDLTLVSGVDFREDGRGFVLFDYNRDGWVDLGIISPNYPRLRIIENRIGEREGKNGFVEVQLIGGQTSAQPSTEWSSREPFGAMVLVTTGQTQRMFQLSCGEGLSSQNAKRIHIGMGDVAKIDKLEVTWPSGKKTVRENVPAGERLTIFENPASETVNR
jgi:hypothetical protein